LIFTDRLTFSLEDDTFCVVSVDKILDPIADAYLPGVQSAIQKGVQTEGDALLGKLSDVFKVKIGTDSFLEFNEEGDISVFSDGSVAYMGTGSAYVDKDGNVTLPPVANTHPLPPPSIWGNSSDFSVAFSNYAMSCLQWALFSSGKLDLSIEHAPASSPIQLTTDNVFFKAAMPGLSNYSGLNLTTSLSPVTTWSESSINASGILLGSSSWNWGFSIVNQSDVVVENAVVLDLTLAIELGISEVSVVEGNKVQLDLKLVSHQAAVVAKSSKIGPVDVKAFDTLLVL
jgi:hypothetical protein